MHKTILLLLAAVVCLAAAACSRTEQANNNSVATPTSSASPAASTKPPPANIVTATAEEVVLAPGSSAEALVKVNIAHGYHINANPASAKFLIPTTLTVGAIEGVAVDAAAPRYPPSLTKKFEFSPDPLAVYEGEALIKVALSISKEKKVGPDSYKLPVTLRVQPCDDKACYPPRTIETIVPILVK